MNRAARELLDLLHGQREPEPEDYVFGGYDGAAITRVDTSWRRLLEEAGIEGFRFHDLRHDFASSLVQRGVPLFTVSQLLGHGDLSMTQIYAHLNPGALADAVAVLDRLRELPR